MSEILKIGWQIFFYFDEISKMRILEPKNAFWKGAKKHGVKKVVESKNVFYKSCQKFYILGGDFFSFWRNFKNEDSRAKKRFTDFAYKTRVFSPGAFKNIFFQKKLYRHHILTYWDDLEPFLIWVMGGAESAPPCTPT